MPSIGKVSAVNVVSLGDSSTLTVSGGSVGAGVGVVGVVCIGVGIVGRDTKSFTEESSVLRCSGFHRVTEIPATSKMARISIAALRANRNDNRGDF